MLVLMEEAAGQGISTRQACQVLRINRGRMQRWKKRDRKGLSLENGKPGPGNAVHALLPEEREQVLELARQEEYADLSHRILTVIGWESGRFFVSFSSVYGILRAEGMTAFRGGYRGHNGRSLPPMRKELSGPNQRWAWDISYLHTFERGIFLYLYLLLDEYSRKVIHWLISWQQTQQEARRLLEEGLLAENILDLPEEARPEVFNDRGRQMKAKSIRRLFEEHQMPQVFTRPRTPNDNPFVESMFSTAKRAPEYPGRFLDKENAEGYFTRYFPWYNTEHYHSGIEYVTPEQAHRGQRERIVSERGRRLEQQRRWRKEVNRAKARMSITTSGILKRTQKGPNQGVSEVWAEPKSSLVGHSDASDFGGQQLSRTALQILTQTQAKKRSEDENLSFPDLKGYSLIHL
jgi:transposase InsO family protein